MSYSHGELVQLAEEGRRKKMPRYIDADKLLARYKERCAGCKETKNYCEHCCDLADVIDDIEDAPTVDLVERKRGKWLDFPVADGLLLCLRCSSCGVLRMGEPLSFFCPWCGADMRGGGGNVE